MPIRNDFDQIDPGNSHIRVYKLEMHTYGAPSLEPPPTTGWFQVGVVVTVKDTPSGGLIGRPTEVIAPIADKELWAFDTDVLFDANNNSRCYNHQAMLRLTPTAQDWVAEPDGSFVYANQPAFKQFGDFILDGARTALQTFVTPLQRPTSQAPTSGPATSDTWTPGRQIPNNRQAHEALYPLQVNQWNSHTDPTPHKGYEVHFLLHTETGKRRLKQIQWGWYLQGQAICTCTQPTATDMPCNRIGSDANGSPEAVHLATYHYAPVARTGRWWLIDVPASS